MTKRKSLKREITEKVLLELPKYSPYAETDIDALMFIWWVTGRSETENLRLTDSGDLAFRLANIEYYDQEFVQEIQTWYKFITEVSKKIKCPYYFGRIKKDKNRDKGGIFIRLYDSKIAMMVKLYGSLQSYLDSVKVKSGRKS